MQLKKIVVGKWYKTKLGAGVCVRSGGCYPPAVQIDVISPFPRGVCTMNPRDVVQEIVMPTPEMV